MFCTIQKLKLKNKSLGEKKYLKVDSYSYNLRGEKVTTYSYHYTDERFDRPILDTYKISLHHSYRENGKVKKKQLSICTVSYYDLATEEIYDFVPYNLEDKIKKMGIKEEYFWTLLNEKVEPLQDEIREEYHQSEEYLNIYKNKAIINKHLANESAFNKKYNNKIQYNNIYNLYAEVMNQELLDKVEREYQAQQKQYQQYSSYYSNSNSNYDYNSLFNTSKSNYTEEEKKNLKLIYKYASLKLHPDICKDSGEAMKLLNKLKEEWGI